MEPLAYAVETGSAPRLAVCESVSPVLPKPRLLERVREALRIRHYSRRTEEAYVAWIRRYIFFHGKRHPGELGGRDVTRFLSALAVEGHVAASTQNQALSALLFLYRDVLDVELPWLDDIVRAKRPDRFPIVPTRDEVRALIQRLDSAPRVMACLLYGAGRRPRHTHRAELLGHRDASTTMTYTHVLNRGAGGCPQPCGPDVQHVTPAVRHDMADGIGGRNPRRPSPVVLRPRPPATGACVRENPELRTRPGVGIC